MRSSAIFGFRRRKGAEVPSSSEARTRQKKRCSNLWVRRMLEKLRARRALPYFAVVSVAALRWPRRWASLCMRKSYPFAPQYTATKTRSAVRKACALSSRPARVAVVFPLRWPVSFSNRLGDGVLCCTREGAREMRC